MKREKITYSSFKARLRARRVCGAPDRRNARRDRIYRIKVAGLLSKIG